MKKLLITLVLLTMAVAANAGNVGFQVAAGDAKDSYLPSDIITIEIFSLIDTFGITMDAIGDGGAGGVASAPLVLNAAYTSFPLVGDITNTGGTLIEGVLGATAVGLPATGVLYSFEYHVPDVPPSTIIEIGPAFPYGWEMNEVTIAAGASVVPDSLLIHVIPEPMTIALLGLGGLFLRRRR